jgi:predicted nucleotidyltransferase
MSSLLPELDEKKVRTRLNQRKRAIHEQILQSLQKVVEQGVLPDGVRMFLFGSRANPLLARPGSDVDVLLLGRMTTTRRFAIEDALRKALPDFALDVVHFEQEADLSHAGRRILAEALEIGSGSHSLPSARQVPSCRAGLPRPTV